MIKYTEEEMELFYKAGIGYEEYQPQYAIIDGIIHKLSLEHQMETDTLTFKYVPVCVTL